MRGRYPTSRPSPLPSRAAPGGVAPAATDGESGNEGDVADEAARSLRALKVMRDRGLLSDAEFEARRREILEGVGGGETA